MQKKLTILFLAAVFMVQLPGAFAQAGKVEFAAGYGYWSIYTLANGKPFNASSGDPTLTVRYYLTRQVTLGLGVGYDNVSSEGSFISVCPEVTVSYLDTRNAAVRVRLYGAAALGIAAFSEWNVGINQADQSGVKLWGFQATPIGVRIGRQFAFYAELGCGYKGLINGGIDIRVPRTFHHHSKEVNY